MDSTGTFTLSSNATLEVGSADGIASSGATGNIQNTGTRTFSAGAHYIYNGTAAQVTGSGLTVNTPANLTINNSSGVTLSGNTTISGTLTLTSGLVTTGSNTLTVNSTGSISGGSSTSYVSGKLAQVIANTTSTLFPLGKGGHYKPLTFTSAAAASRTVTVEHFDSGTPLSFSNTSRARFGLGYWNINQSATGTAYTVGLSAGSASPTGTVVLLRREGSGAATSIATSFSSPYYSNSSTLSTGNASNDVMLAETAIPLTVTGATAANKVYDGTTTATITGGTLVGVVGSDTVALTQAGTFAAKDAGTAIAIISNCSLSGANSGAYVLTQPTLSAANITAKALSITAPTIASKVYDGSANTGAITVGNLSGFVGTETVTASATGVYADANAGTGKTATVSYTLSDGSNGGLATNYSLASGSATGDITPAGLTITGITANNKIYDGNNTATLNGTALYSGLQNGENFGVSGSPSATFNNKDVGTSKPVTVSGYTAPNSNYSITQPTLSADITKRTLTPTFTAANKVYDGGTSATISGYSVSNTVSGESVNASGGSATFNNKDIGVGKTVTVAGLGLTGTDAGNYQLSTTTTTTTADITAAPLTVSNISADNKTYDGTTTATLTTSSYTLNGIVGTEVVTLNAGSYTANFNNKNVGTSKPVTVMHLALSGADAGNYTLTQPSLSANITQRAITITATADSKTYDGNTSSGTSPTLTSGSLVSGDVATYSQTFDNENTGTSKTLTPAVVSIVDGSSANMVGNYDVTLTPTTNGTITAKALSITSPTIASKVYDGSANTGAITPGTLSGFVGTETLTATATGVYADANIGTGKTATVTYTLQNGNNGGLATNYSLAQGSGSGDITAAGLTITGITADNKTYDGSTAATLSGTAQYAGLQNGENFSVTGNPTATFDTKNIGTNKTVTVSGYTAPNSNYSLTQPTLSADITARSLTPSFTAANKVYDGNTTATISGYSVSNAVSGETVNASGGTATFNTKDIGTGKTVTVTGLGLTGADAGNYQLTTTTTTTMADITAKALTVSNISADNKTYDGTTAATLTTSSYSLTGIVGVEVVTLNASTYTADFNTPSVGTTKPVTVSGLALAGIDAGNYTLTQPTGLTANITAAGLTITGITANNKTYDGSTAATLSGTPQYVGLQNGESFQVTGTPAATFDTKNVGTGKTVTVSGYTAPANYSITQPTLTANITQRPITITAAADSKTYDANTSSGTSPTITSGTLAAGDVGTYSQTFNNKNTGTGKTLTPAVVSIVDGAGANMANNYAVTLTPTTNGTITAKALSITAPTIASKVYDGSAVTGAITPGSLSGLIGTETIGVTATGLYTDPNVGTGKAATVTYSYTDGTNGGVTTNYSLPSSGSGTGDITKAVLTVTADNKTVIYGDAVPALTHTITGFVNSEDEASAGVTGAPVLTSGYSSATPVSASPVAINVSAGNLSAQNYSFSTAAGNITINKKSATVTANNMNKCDGSLLTFAGTEFSTSGIINSDAVSGATISSTGAADNASAAGAPYDITIGTATGTGLDNYTLTYAPGSLNFLARPTSAVSLSGNAVICSGSSSEISVTLSGAGPWDLSYSDGVNATALNGVTVSPAVIPVSPTATSTYTVTALSDANCVSQSGDRTGSTTITVPTMPASGTVAGNASECIPVANGSKEFTFSNNEILETYTWSVPAGMSITSGQGTNSLTASWTASAAGNGIVGQVCVVASNQCSTATAICKTINYQSAIPVTPGSVSGNAKLCPDAEQTFSVSLVARAAEYTWSLPSNMSLVSGSGSNIINASVAAGYTGGTLTVRASNACGISPIRSKSLGLNTPLTPGVITGQSTGLCNAQNVTFTTSGTSAATSYSWTLPTGSQFDGSSNGTTVTVGFGSLSGNITVRGVNGCGQGNARSVSVTMPPPRPGSIAGDNSALPNLAPCTGQTESYEVPSATSATSYNWTVPSGSVINGQAPYTKDLSVTFSPVAASSQLISVSASNACGTSPVRSLSGINIISCSARESMEGNDFFVTAYPNPTQGEFNLAIESLKEQRFSFILTTLMGHVVRSEEWMMPAGAQVIPIKLEGHDQGLYLLQVGVGDTIKTLRVLYQ